MSNKLTELIAKRAIENKNPEIVGKALGFTHTLARMNTTSLDSVLRAMDTQTAGEGKEWINVGLDPEIVMQVVSARKVAALFRRIPLRANPYTWPVEGGRPQAYGTPENTADTGQTSVKFSNAASAATTFTARKVSVAVRMSDEFQQDAVFDVERFVNQQVLLGLSDGEENLFINGALAGTHPDADVTVSDDVRKQADGLRARVNSGAKVDGGTGSLISAVNKARARMGNRYASDPSRLAIITGINGYLRLQEEDAVKTLDKFGPNATVLTGELGKVNGIPLIVSDFIREDLNATGVYDGTTTNKTIALIVYRDAYAIGDRQEVTMEDAREPFFGQDSIIGRERVAFERWYAANQNTVALINNIALL